MLVLSWHNGGCLYTIKQSLQPAYAKCSSCIYTHIRFFLYQGLVILHSWANEKSRLYRATIFEIVLTYEKKTSHANFITCKDIIAYLVCKYWHIVFFWIATGTIRFIAVAKSHNWILFLDGDVQMLDLGVCTIVSHSVHCPQHQKFNFFLVFFDLLFSSRQSVVIFGSIQRASVFIHALHSNVHRSIE